ncbi:MAG: pilus assembly protein PilP [Bdellovibrionales bacterium]
MKKSHALQILAPLVVFALGVARAQDSAAPPPPPPLPNPEELPHSSPPAPSMPQAEPPSTAPSSAGTPPSSEPPPDAPPTGTAQAPAQPESPNSGIADLEGFLEPFIYDIVNRRDPFQAYVEFVPVEDEGPPRALTPAQRYDLEQLKLVGIMWDIKDPKAMFMDPDQEVLILGRDESIGNRNGYIAAIREGEVVVVEAIRKRGDIIYRTRVLRIER